MLVCNPTKRAFSDFSLHKREPRLWLSHRIKDYASFGEFIREGVDFLEEGARKNNETFVMRIKNKKVTPNFNKYSILTSSQYVVQLKYYLKFFEKRQLVFVKLKVYEISKLIRKCFETDSIMKKTFVFLLTFSSIGDKLAKNPGPVMEKLQRDLGLPIEISRTDFVVNPETGFPCVTRVNLERQIHTLPNTIYLHQL